MKWITQIAANKKQYALKPYTEGRLCIDPPFLLTPLFY